ncbi:MAG: hypothetical protein II177_07280, partial [Lachnospiraceae bacterium]|nr:hypothetical protein [Lachnospiraceae bacterium]
MESAGVETTRAEPMHINPARIVQAGARPARIDAEQGNSGRVVMSGRHPGSTGTLFRDIVLKLYGKRLPE